MLCDAAKLDREVHQRQCTVYINVQELLYDAREDAKVFLERYFQTDKLVGELKTSLKAKATGWTFAKLDMRLLPVHFSVDFLESFVASAQSMMLSSKLLKSQD